MQPIDGTSRSQGDRHARSLARVVAQSANSNAIASHAQNMRGEGRTHGMTSQAVDDRQEAFGIAPGAGASDFFAAAPATAAEGFGIAKMPICY